MSASLCRVGMLTRPPYGDQVAIPVSSNSTTSTLGAPSGACLSSYGVQSGFESRTSNSIFPLKPALASSAAELLSVREEESSSQPAASADAAATPIPAAAMPPNIERRVSLPRSAFCSGSGASSPGMCMPHSLLFKIQPRVVITKIDTNS